MNNLLRVLMVEDSTDDAALIERELRQGGYDPHITRVETAEELNAKLSGAEWDLIMADYVMPNFDGMKAIQMAREHAPDTPFILMSGKIGEDLAVAALKAGADNYIMKDKLRLLSSTVRHELESARLAQLNRILEQQNLLLSQALRQSPLSILITGSTGQIQYANHRVTEQTGYLPEELEGQNPRIFQSGETPENTYQELWGSLLKKDSWHGVLLNRKKNGQVFWEQVSIAPVVDASDSITNFVAVKEDISERIQRDTELKNKNAEMESFTYTVSHDLRSPLVTFKTFLGYLREDIGKNDHELIAKDMDFMESAANKMERLLNGLLSLSRVGRIVNPPSEIGFRKLIEDTLSTMTGEITNCGATVTVTPTDIHLYGDSIRLQEIWQNLVGNAVKYMGGQNAPQVWIGVEQDGDDTVFFVRDNGMGIDSRYKEKIFGLFEKLDVSSEDVGIGLALVKKILEVYGGRIWVESEGPGYGSCFRFTLPGAVSPA